MSFKITSGRKRESTVWQHFSHDAVPDKSMCLVSTADGKQCGRMIAGKNTTNLMNHLKFNHASVHKAVVDAESAKSYRLQHRKKMSQVLPGPLVACNNSHCPVAFVNHLFGLEIHMKPNVEINNWQR